MKNLRRITAFSLALLLSVPPFAPRTVWALEGTITTKEDTDLIPGVTYSATTAQTSGGQIKSHTLTVSPDSTAYPLTAQGSAVVYYYGNINKAIEYATAAGHNIIGAVNSDYFSLSTGVATGIVIEDGVYKSSPSHFSSILFNGNQTTILGEFTIPISVENDRTGESLTLEHLNKYRSDTGGLYLLTRDFSSTTRTNSDGMMVRMQPTEHQMAENGGVLTVNSTLELEVVEAIDTSFAWDIGDNDYILTAAHQSGYQEMLAGFEVGDIVTLTTSTSHQAVIDAQWATGGGDIMISEGALTTSSRWEHINDGRAPRSAIGVKEDGTLLYYAVDGRQSSSVGLSQLALANHLLDEGCYYAVNLDGGGSTSFAVSALTAPYTLSGATVVNSPSDGSLRSCSTFLLFADPQIPSQLLFDGDVSVILLDSHIELGTVSVRDVNKTKLDQYPVDTQMEPHNDLGVLSFEKDSQDRPVYYYKANEKGAEFFSYYSPEYDLSGESTIEIVDSLSSLLITDPQTQEQITAITLKPDATMELDFQASINHVPVHANGDAILWEVYPQDIADENENYGSITPDGVFTAGKKDCYVQFSAGGEVAQLPVTIHDMFDDVPEGHWAYEAIGYLSGNGIVSGYSDTEFGLGSSISRGDFVLMLYRAFEMPEVSSSVSSLFSDLEDSDYASTAISWAVANGIASGMGDGSFGTKNSITREQAAVIMHKAFTTMGINLPTTAISTLTQYQDQHEISSYAMLSIASLTAQDLLNDTDQAFYPKTALTRESMALYLYNMLHFTLQPQEMPSQIALQTSEVSLVPGESYSLLPLLEPSGSGSNITWSSSDPSAVTVSSSGLVTNVFTGTGNPVVTITATTGTVSTSCIVRCMATGTATSNPSFYLPNLGGPSSDQSQGSTSPTLSYTGLVVDAPGGLNVRQQADSSGTVVTLLNNGTLVNVHDKTNDGGWILVSTPVPNSASNVQGYVMSQYLQERTTYGTVDASDVLNLRSGAGTAFNVIGQLATGTQVVVLQIFADWYKVQAMIDGVATTGFVSASYLTLS